jgi:uncharacterized repeat protein (TIGR01451 family)
VVDVTRGTGYALRLLAAVALIWSGQLSGAFASVPSAASSAAGHPSAAHHAQRTAAIRPPVRDTGLAISPVFSQTLVGGFTQAGNTLFDCDRLTDGSALPSGGCVRDINTALGTPSPSRPFYNNQVIMRNMDRDTNPNTTTSSSATVNIPAGATVVFADLNWLGTSQASPNPNIQWNPNIYTQPMKLSIDDDQHYSTIFPTRGTSIQPGQPASDTNDYYYTSSAVITPLLQGRTGQIQLWGADAPFPVNGFNQASLGWDVVVVYQYPSVDLAAGHVGKLITIQNGFVYQQSGKAATNTVVNVPSVTDPDSVEVGLIAGEGDTGLSGDTFAVNGHNITHPVTGQTNNFFVSYAQGATNPNWTSNMATDDVTWTLAPGIVHAGDTSVTLTTQTSGDGFMLRGLNTAIPVPSVGLEKDVPARYTTVGAPLTYTFTVTNTSGAPIHGLSVNDPSLGGDVVSCDHPAVLAPGAAYQCTATRTITRADIAAGQIPNTATAHALGADGEALTDTASASSSTSTFVAITKTGDPKPINAGDPFTYTLTVTNLGTADAVNVRVTDPLPAELNNPQATISTTDGTVSIASDGTLTAFEPVLGHAPASSSFTITITGTIASPFTGGTSARRVITNAATVQAPNTNCTAGSTDPACEDSDTTTVLQPEIAINKATDQDTPKPGDSFTYTVIVHNRSLTTPATATISDPIPAPLTGASWTCVTTSVASNCGVGSGTGDISGVPITLAPGDFAVFHITVTVPTGFQGGTILNTATATPTGPTLCADDLTAPDCSADVPVTVTPDPAQLQITKSHTPLVPAPIPGQSVTYTVVVTNTSTSTVAHATFDDPVPAGIDASGATWSTATTGAGTTVSPASGTGFPTGQTINMTIDPGGTVTFTINAAVDASFSGTDITNVASATPGANTSCEDTQPTCDAEDSFTVPARLAVTKSHSPDNPDPSPGSQVTYTVVITNPGNGIGVGTFSDALPAELDESTAAWTCAATGTGSNCGTATGSGSPSAVPIAVEAGGNVTFTITATVRPSDVPITVHNVGTVTPGNNTLCQNGDPTCDASDVFTSTPDPATLNITKSHAPADPVQGDSVTYTVTVTNTSQTTRAVGTVTDDPFTPALTGITWTAAVTGGATVSPDSGSGAIVAVPVVIPVGGTVTFTIHATVRPSWPGGDVVNTAAVTPGHNTVCDPTKDPACSDETVFSTPSLITITKAHHPIKPAPRPSQRVVYTVVVTNLSPNQGAEATLNDPLPPQLVRASATWTTTVTGTGTTATPSSGTGPPTGVALSLGPEGTVTFTIIATVRSSFLGGTVTNTASATPGASTACKPAAPTCDATTSFDSKPNPARLRVTKTYSPHTPTIQRGQAVTYTVTVTNLSRTTTGNGIVDDPRPAGIVGMAWSAVATAGSFVSPASGSGAVSGVRVRIAPRGQVTFTVTGRVDPTFHGSFNIANIATVTTGRNTKCAPLNKGQSCSSAAVFHVPVPTSPGQQPPAPPSPGLPFTGLNADSLMRDGVLLLLLGTSVLSMARRRRSSTAPGLHRM